jgi:hypothetical protein
MARLKLSAGQDLDLLLSPEGDGKRLVLQDVVSTEIGGGERDGNSETLSGGEIYSVRGIIGLKSANVAVPEPYYNKTLNVLSHLRERGLSELPDENLISIPMNGQSSFVRAASAWMLSEEGRQILEERGITTLNTFIGHEAIDQAVTQLRENFSIIINQGATGPISDRANNKCHQLKDLKKRGVNVPNGFNAHSVKGLIRAVFSFYISLPKHSRKLGVVKRALSASGFGMADKFRNMQDLFSALGKDVNWKHMLRYGIRLEEWITEEKIDSPGVMIYIHKSGDYHIVSSADQKLGKLNESDNDETVHMASHGPSDILSDKGVDLDMDKAAAHLHEEGYEGFASLDFMRTKAGDLRNVEIRRMTEINAREVGQGHAAKRAYYLFGTALDPDRQWAAANNIGAPMGTTIDQIYYILNERGIVFNPETKFGVAVAGAPCDFEREVGGTPKFFGFVTAPTRERLNQLIDLAEITEEDVRQLKEKLVTTADVVDE